MIQYFEDFRLGDTGVCLVSRSEAEGAILELRSNQGLAFLTTEKNVGAIPGTTGLHSCHVQMLSAKRWARGGRYSTRGGRISANCTVNQTRGRRQMTRPKSAAAQWLGKFGVEPVDFLPPKFGEREGVEVIVRVQKDFLEKVLRGSGEFGVFSRPCVRGEPRAHKDVQLPEGFDFQAALRKAKGSWETGGKSPNCLFP